MLDIIFGKMCGQCNFDDSGLLQVYSEDDIFKADETCCHFDCLPDKRFTFKSSLCHGDKHSKNRATVLFLQILVVQKLRPVVIGRPSRPRWFTNIKSLLEYKNNKKLQPLHQDLIHKQKNQLSDAVTCSRSIFFLFESGFLLISLIKYFEILVLVTRNYQKFWHKNF